MSKYNFPIGAEIIRPGSPICTYLGDGMCERPSWGKWVMLSDDWELVNPGVLPEPTTTKEDTTVSKFKVGDKIKCVNNGDNTHISLGSEYRVLALDFGVSGYIKILDDREKPSWYLEHRFVLVQPEPAHESDWSYAEAERLQKLAHEAIDAYNEYINAKPNTVFLTIFK